MTRSTFSLSRILPAAAILACAPVFAGAQSAPKKVLGVSDYTRWRSIEAAGISGDGRWVASVWRFTNVQNSDSKPELHLRNLDAATDVVIAHASSPMFSSDSKWIVYQVDSVPAARGGRGGRGAAAPDSSGTAPAPGSAAQGGGGRGGAGGAAQPLRRYELRELASGTTRAWKDISSATFNNASTYLPLKRSWHERERCDRRTRRRWRRWRRWRRGVRWRRGRGWRRWRKLDGAARR